MLTTFSVLLIARWSVFSSHIDGITLSQETVRLVFSSRAKKSWIALILEWIFLIISKEFRIQSGILAIGNISPACATPWHKQAISLSQNNWTMSTEPLKPTSIPSLMNRFAYPMKALEISVVCFEEEYATKQAKLIQEEISRGLDLAIMKGWSHSNSMYQNLRVEGKKLTFEFYQSLSSLIHIGGSFCMVPLTYYNQYEKPNIQSVTFKYVLEDAEAGYIGIFDNTFHKALEDDVIDSYTIEDLAITATSTGSNPFKRLLDTYMKSTSLIDDLKRTKHQATESDKSLKSSVSSIMITVAFIIMLSLLLKVIVG